MSALCKVALVVIQLPLSHLSSPLPLSCRAGTQWVDVLWNLGGNTTLHGQLPRSF